MSHRAMRLAGRTVARAVACALALCLVAAPAAAQPAGDVSPDLGTARQADGAAEPVEVGPGDALTPQLGPRSTTAGGPVDLTNPLSVLGGAASGLDRLGQEAPAVADPEDTGLSGPLSIILILTVLTLAPTILVLCTSFTRIVIVLALLRQALGTQTLPPSQVIVGLSLLLTMMVMAPTFEQVHRDAILPLQDPDSGVTETQAWELAKRPVRDFMFAQIEATRSWDSVYMMLNYRGVDTSEPEKLERQDVDMLALIPAFVLSELKTAFLIGFQMYLPFLVIDMVIASVLISMGMLMLPPVLISLPFKLLLFVMVDGWNLVAGNLLNSFVQTGAG